MNVIVKHSSVDLLDKMFSLAEQDGQMQDPE